MAEDTNKAAAEAPAKVAETVADTAEKTVAETAKTQKTVQARAKRQAKRAETATKSSARRAKAPRRSAKTTGRKAATATRKAAAATQGRIEDVNTNTNRFFAGFEALPAFAPFNSLFADAGERGQDLVRRSQQVAEEMADVTRANVEALVEAGRVAAEGARTIGQDVVASTREGVEKTADAIRTLAEAKSPTEFVQLQGEFARNSFDRMVAETSRLTETMVKFAGEAFQPISNRATANTERFNTLVA